MYLFCQGGFHLLAHGGGGGGWQNYIESLSHITQPPSIAMENEKPALYLNPPLPTFLPHTYYNHL